MSNLDDVLGGSRRKFDKGTWHQWQKMVEGDGRPRLAKKMVWDRATKTEKEGWLSVFAPFEGEFVEIWTWDDKKTGVPKFGVKLKVNGEFVQFSTTSVRTVTRWHHTFRKGDQIRISRFGEGSQTQYEEEVLVPTQVQETVPGQDQSFPQDPEWVNE